MRLAPLALTLALAGLARGCLTPPVLHWYDQFPPDLEGAGYPRPFEVVELEVEPDVRLRGVFVGAGEGAPVVLHLLGSGSSAVGTYHWRDGVLRAPPVVASLRAAGFSSLVVDYRGVGASDGERSPDHFARDVEVMYAAALARAGAPRRVFLRAISIGTLPAGQLLRAGHVPAGVLLVAPVRNETVVEHFAYREYPDLFAFLGLMWYRLPVELETDAVLSRVECPLLVLAPRDDHFLPRAEREPLRAAVEAAGGRWLALGEHHEDLSLAARELLPEELEFLQGALRAR
jgi:pimeloyl-ACP methyl ester carboxylesterase